MSRHLLAVMALIQAAIVAFLFGLLIWHRFVRTFRQEYRARKARAVASALRAWIVAPDYGQAVRQAFRWCPIPAGREGLEEIWAERDAAQRESLSRLIGPLPWSQRARRNCRSRFWWKRMEASQILVFLDDPKDVLLLRERLWDRIPAVRAAAVFAARELTPPELLDDLLELIVEAEPARHRVLLHTLRAYGSAVVPALVSHLDNKLLGTTGRANLLALAEHLVPTTPDPALAECLLSYACDFHLEVRVKAIRALAHLPGEPVEATLIRALKDPAWEVRAQAAKALGRRGDPAAAFHLRGALKDRAWWVRLRAGVALRQLGAAGRTVLRAAQRETDAFARDMASYALHLDEAAVQEYAS